MKASCLSLLVMSLVTHAQAGINQVQTLTFPSSLTILTYQADDRRSPFTLPDKYRSAQQAAEPNCPSLEAKRASTALMQLKGIIGDRRKRQAIVQLANGELAKLSVGHHFGSKTVDGVISQVNPANIVVKQEWQNQDKCRPIRDVIVTVEKGAAQ